MKKVKKWCTIFVTGIILLSSVACGGVPNSEYDLQIHFWRSGHGSEFLNTAIADFEKEYPQYKVSLETTSDVTAMTNNLVLDPKYNTVDLYLCSVGPLANKYFEYLEPLDDILTETYKEEGKTIGEKFDPSVLDALEAPDGNHYALSYSGGWCGIVYNASVIDGVNYQVPQTTDDLEMLTMLLKADGKTPFVHFSTGGYWNRVFNVWEAQYDGLDYYLNEFWTLGDLDAPSKDIMLAEDGRREVLEVMDSIITPEYVLNGSNTSTFTEAQTYFLNGDAVMMANGGWLLNEMKSSSAASKANLRMMKVPLISSIVETLLYRNAGGGYLSESELKALVTEVDRVGGDSSQIVNDGSKGFPVLDPKDIERVYTARNTMNSIKEGNIFAVPVYSNAKEAAKTFIKFFYSDGYLRKFADILHMAPPLSYSDGSKVDTSDWTEWEKQQVAFDETQIPIYTYMPKANRLFSVGGATPYAGIDFVTNFASRTGRKDAQGVWNLLKQTVNDSWSGWLSNAQFQ